MKTDRKGKEKFWVPTYICEKARSATKKGVKILVTPNDLIQLMNIADRALNGDSNDAEHDALYQIRESLSALYEDPERTYMKAHEEERLLLLRGIL